MFEAPPPDICLAGWASVCITEMGIILIMKIIKMMKVKDIEIVHK
jgi:hypothetical protein